MGSLGVNLLSCRFVEAVEMRYTEDPFFHVVRDEPAPELLGDLSQAGSQDLYALDLDVGAGWLHVESYHRLLVELLTHLWLHAIWVQGQAALLDDYCVFKIYLPHVR